MSIFILLRMNNHLFAWIWAYFSSHIEFSNDLNAFACYLPIESAKVIYEQNQSDSANKLW